MTTLDNPSNIPNIPEVPFRQTAIKYGAFGGLLLIVLGLIFYVTELTDPTDPDNSFNTVANLLNYAVLIAAIVMAIKFHKNEELGGYLTMGRSIGLGTLTALVLSLITAVWVVVFFAVIDPAMLDGIREMSLEKALEGGAQRDQVEGMVNLFTSPSMIAAFIVVIYVLVGLVIGLITGAVLKKEPPMFA